MFSDLSGLDLVLANLLAMILWNIIVFFFSIRINVNFFDPSKPIYKEKRWEKSGKLYIKTFKVKRWKDFLPQHIGKNGFSKKNLKHLSDLSKEYIQQFIAETCRAEWNHIMCCSFSIISIFINTLSNGIIVSILSVTINFPFIIIQRYNRIRLSKLLQKSKTQKEKINYNIVNA